MQKQRITALKFTLFCLSAAILILLGVLLFLLFKSGGQTISNAQFVFGFI
ncbi:MAG: hypothetical protein IJF16_04405 [Clostridia bacterium]|nr:hypothetical protein [Clostridia bacterium]